MRLRISASDVVAGVVLLPHLTPTRKDKSTGGGGRTEFALRIDARKASNVMNLANARLKRVARCV